MFVDLILEEPERVAFISENDLAKEIGVDVATVSRFVKSLGINHYSKFADMIKANIKIKSAYTSRLLTDNDITDTKTLAIRGVRKDSRSLAAMKNNFDSETFDKAIEAMSLADKIYVIGIDHIYYLAEMFASLMNKFEQKAIVFKESNDLATLTENDVVISMSFINRGREVEKSFRHAKSVKATTISILELVDDITYKNTDILLNTPCGVIAYLDSATTIVSMINLLITGYMIKNRKKVEEVFKKIDKIG